MKALVFALSLGVAMGQAPSVSTVFQFHHIEGEQAINEIATMVRTIAEVPQIQVDAAARTISMTAGRGPIQIAEWLLAELDRAPYPATPTQQFDVASDGSDVVRVLYLTHPPTLQAFQEIATSVRTIVEIRRAFTYGAGRAIVLRGTADEIAASAWIVEQLDQPAEAKHAEAKHVDAEYKIVDRSERGETQIRVVYVPYAETVRQFQDIARAIRATGNISRVFTYWTTRGIIVRGMPDEVPLASWLVKELAKPAEGIGSDPYQYPDHGGDGAVMVRLLYVKGAPTTAAFQPVALRVKTQMRRVFTYDATKALAVRGTPDQVAAAEQFLKDRELK